MICVGAISNAAGILIGGIAGLTLKKQPSAASQGFFKVALGAFTVFYGLRLMLLNLDGFSLNTLRLLTIVILALFFGKLLGRLFRLQKISNRIGQQARNEMTRAMSGKKINWSDGFNTCALLFCVAPLAILGSASDGLSAYFPPLLIKTVMDGLAAMGFVTIFGWSALASALPVFIFESALTTAAALFAKPFLESHNLLTSVNATTGILIFCVALLIFEIKKIEVANYLPALFVAPLIAWIWK